MFLYRNVIWLNNISKTSEDIFKDKKNKFFYLYHSKHDCFPPRLLFLLKITRK